MNREKISNRRFGVLLLVFWLITLKLMGSNISNDDPIDLFFASILTIPWTLPGAFFLGVIVLVPLNYLLNGRIEKWLEGE